MDGQNRDGDRPSRLLTWSPDFFLTIVALGELEALLTIALGWPERVVWAAVVTVLWAGVQGMMLSFAVTGLTKGQPLNTKQLLAALLRSVGTTGLFFAVVVLTVKRPSLTSKIAFGVSAAAMLCNTVYVMILKKRIS